MKSGRTEEMGFAGRGATTELEGRFMPIDDGVMVFQPVETKEKIVTGEISNSKDEPFFMWFSSKAYFNILGDEARRMWGAISIEDLFGRGELMGRPVVFVYKCSTDDRSGATTIKECGGIIWKVGFKGVKSDRKGELTATSSDIDIAIIIWYL
jgi:hypothetical protein